MENNPAIEFGIGTYRGEIRHISTLSKASDAE
jgi:hypothetical protein